MLAETPLAYAEHLADVIARGFGQVREAVAERAVSNGHAQFVAEAGGRLVGSAGAFDYEQGRTALMSVYVTAAWRGCGVLEGLVGAVEQWSRQHGRYTLLLLVAESNARAIARSRWPAP
jgi:GNAT superfamily N-acetyltransferase